MSAIQHLHENSVLSLIESIAAGVGLEDGYSLAWFSPDAFSSLSTSWSTEVGVFVFLRADLANLDQGFLQQQLRDFLDSPPYLELRFLWIENPVDPLILWRTSSISAQSEVLERRAYLPFRNYAFSMAPGTALAFANDVVSCTPTTNETAPFFWSTAHGEHLFFNHISAVTIPMSGSEMGCLRFSFRLPKENWPENRIENGQEITETYFGYPGLAQLDIGIRMFFRDPEFPVSGDDFYLASHRYPFLQESYTGIEAEAFFPPEISWSVQLDFLYPLSRKRSYFEFTPASLGTGLPSAYRTNRGYSVHLLPKVQMALAETENARLYFSPRPATLRSEELADAPLYLVPSGKFTIQVPQYAPKTGQPGQLVEEANIICGVSGLEYIKVTSQIESILLLVPDQAAFAPAFVSAYALLRDLTAIIESKAKANLPLPKDTVDLDMPIEELFNEGLGINDHERMDILQLVKDFYFPPDYVFSAAAESEFRGLEIVEELVNWLREMLQGSVRYGDGQAPLVIYTDSQGMSFPTTAWAYFIEVGGTTYYGQPDQAVLYKAESSSSEFLDFMEVPAIGLPDSLTTAQEEQLALDTTHEAMAFPVLPYGNVDSDRLTDMLQLENLLINNFRYSRIRAISQVTDHLTPLKNVSSSDPARTGTTPQGLLVTFSTHPNFPDALQIERLQLAMNQNGSLVQMVNISHDAAFKAVLQSNQLFMVLTDPAALQAYFSIAALQGLTDVTNQIDIENWQFELGTDHWDKNGTILVFKFNDKPLIELASQPTLWSLPDDFNINKNIASLGLQELVKNALESAVSSDAKERKKYAALIPAITQANWTGILAFNVAVPLGNLPDDLKALAGGIDPDLFYAQYVGIEVTPIESSGIALSPKPSSMFALIDYQNEVVSEGDLTGYNFHVPFLTVVFRNSLITDFAAEVQLFLQYLFHEEAFLRDRIDEQNVISLKGVAERHNGKTTYSFGFSGANIFDLSGKVMQEVEITKAQFATDPLPPKDDRAETLPVTGRFFLWGRIRFAYLADFDALSFGAEPEPFDPPDADFLSMSNLQISMSFKLHSAPVSPPEDTRVVTDKEFVFRPQQMAFDLNRSGSRRQSLYEKFPLKFKAFKTVNADPNALNSSGYMPVNTPLPTVELGDTWYGLEYDLNLGSAGALAGSMGMIAGILLAWKPEAGGLYVGLKLPGSTGGKKEITVQGLLKIAFKSIRFESYDDPQVDAQDNKGYLLKLKNIVIKFMVVSFPPSGKTEIILFGDPRTKEEVPLRKDKLLGWYASYVKK